MTADDDNTLSKAKKPGYRIKRFFAGGKEKEVKTTTTKKAPVKPVVASQEAAPPKAEPEPIKEEEPVPEVEATEKVPAEYVDDNDGKKDNTCAACEGCTIL